MKKSKLNRVLSSPLLLSGIVALAFTTAPVVTLAQSSANSSNQLEEVVVTGSRIARNPETYMGGMSIVQGSAISQVPSYSTEDMLQKIPSIGLQGLTRNDANGGTGANFTEIHGLGINRTLVLMNGKRMVSTVIGPTGLAVDMQSFPINMINRVEVLADGASAVYGSDAIAGVVNVITRSKFEGVELSGGAGIPLAGGGEAYNGGILMGIQGSNGHFIAGATVSDTANINESQRSWSKYPILGYLDLGVGHPVPLMGSGIPPQGAYSGNNIHIIFQPNPATGASYENYDTFGLSGLNGSSGNGTLQSIIQTNHRYNYNLPKNGSSLVAPARVINAGAEGEYTMDNGISAYGNMLMDHREQTLFFTPLPISGAAGRFTNLIQVPFTNPHIPADALAVIQADVLSANPTATSFQMAWRAADLGPRLFKYNADTMKITGGFKGDLDYANRHWNWDTWVTWGQSSLGAITFNQVNVNNLQIALDPAQCALVSTCPKNNAGVPTMNIFGRHPTTPAEKAFILYNDHEQTDYQMYQLGGSIATDNLFQMPAGGVGFAAGVEYRNASGSDTPSGVVSEGDSGGNYSQATAGGYDVWEGYAETQIPLLKDRQFFKNLSLEAALRYSDYGGAIGSDTTWKVGFHWTPMDMITFRGEVSTGFRAPNILELYGGKSDNFIGVTDPCNAAERAKNATYNTNCAALGVPATYTQPAAQLKVSNGGNPNLTAETSDNYSVGAVITPSEFEYLHNFSVTADYYNVVVKGAVSTPDPATVIDTCYNSPGLTAPECARLTRGGLGTDHSITRFDLLLENLNKIKTSGIDINSRYGIDTRYGHLDFSWLVNWLENYSETTATGVVNNYTGTVACDVCDYTAYPDWRSYFNATLSRDNWSLGFSWRYIDGMHINDEIGLESYTFSTPGVSYFDARATYDWRNIHFMIGAENLADRDPPYVPSVSTNTSPIYDYLGRTVFVRATAKF